MLRKASLLKRIYVVDAGTAVQTCLIPEGLSVFIKLTLIFLIQAFAFCVGLIVNDEPLAALSVKNVDDAGGNNARTIPIGERHFAIHLISFQQLTQDIRFTAVTLRAASILYAVFALVYVI